MRNWAAALVWGLLVKYLLRLENGTENVILNEAFLEAKTANHDCFPVFAI